MPSLAMQLLGQGLQLMPVHVKLFGIENAFFLAVLEECRSNYNFFFNEEPQVYKDKSPEFMYLHHKDMGLPFEWYLEKFELFRQNDFLSYAVTNKESFVVGFNFYHHMVAKFISRADLRKETPECFHERNKEKYG
jgi:hypothetical protein